MTEVDGSLSAEGEIEENFGEKESRSRTVVAVEETSTFVRFRFGGWEREEVRGGELVYHVPTCLSDDDG